MISMVALLAFWQLPVGDIRGSVRIDPPAPRIGEPATLVVALVNRTPGGTLPEEIDLPQGYEEGPWTLTPLPSAGPGMHSWRVVFARPGSWDMPDIPIRYMAPGTPLRESVPLLRFLDGPRVSVLPANTDVREPEAESAIARLLAAAWWMMPLGWIAWRSWLALSWPGTREAFRARLATEGLPPGRHLDGPVRSWWRNRGLPARALENALAGKGAWPDPRAYPVPWFWMLWLALGAV